MEMRNLEGRVRKVTVNITTKCQGKSEMLQCHSVLMMVLYHLNVLYILLLNLVGSIGHC